MKNKVYIIGPPSSGKTTFTHKIMGRDFITFKKYIIECTDIPDDLSDAIQIYLMLPDRKEWEARGGIYTDEMYEKYMEFYNINAGELDIALITDF